MKEIGSAAGLPLNPIYFGKIRNGYINLTSKVVDKKRRALTVTKQEAEPFSFVLQQRAGNSTAVKSFGQSVSKHDGPSTLIHSPVKHETRTGG